jgi:hypothetical protein
MSRQKKNEWPEESLLSFFLLWDTPNFPSQSQITGRFGKEGSNSDDQTKGGRERLMRWKVGGWRGLGMERIESGRGIRGEICQDQEAQASRHTETVILPPMATWWRGNEVATVWLWYG